jgi:hypothetical protein
MKLIPLGRGLSAKVDDEDFEDLMAWPIPPADGVDYRKLDFVKQFYLAPGASDTSRSATSAFPRSATCWDEGAITAITSTTVTIGGKTWDTDRWVGYTSVGLPVARSITT